MGSSVVDYAAWKKGYMPPGEHVLIDQLAYRGAKVKFSSHVTDTEWWIVANGAFGVDEAEAIIETLKLYVEFSRRDREDLPKPNET